MPGPPCAPPFPAQPILARSRTLWYPLVSDDDPRLGTLTDREFMFVEHVALTGGNITTGFFRYKKRLYHVSQSHRTPDRWVFSHYWTHFIPSRSDGRTGIVFRLRNDNLAVDARVYRALVH